MYFNVGTKRKEKKTKRGIWKFLPLSYNTNKQTRRDVRQSTSDLILSDLHILFTWEKIKTSQKFRTK